IGDAGGRAHAAEKAVALHQQRAAASARRGDRGGYPRRAATQYDHFIFAIKRHAAGGFFDGTGHAGVPRLIEWGAGASSYLAKAGRNVKAALAEGLRAR